MASSHGERSMSAQFDHAQSTVGPKPSRQRWPKEYVRGKRLREEDWDSLRMWG